MITHVKFVGIPARDQPRALKFYTEQYCANAASSSPASRRSSPGVPLRSSRTLTAINSSFPPA